MKKYLIIILIPLLLLTSCGEEKTSSDEQKSGEAAVTSESIQAARAFLDNEAETRTSDDIMRKPGKGAPAGYNPTKKLYGKRYNTKPKTGLNSIYSAGGTSGTGTPTSSGKVLYDENGVKIVYTGTHQDEYAFYVDLYMENNIGYDIEVQVRDVSINGFMIEPTFSSGIADGKKTNDDIDFRLSDLEKNGIFLPTEIELKFHFFDWDDWGSYFDSDVVNIQL